MDYTTFLNFSFYNLIMYFFIYSFLGWCVEVFYAFKNQRKFVNRGFLHGPLCPIYGSCILLMIILLSNFKGNFFILFLAATLATSVIEYITGFILEKLFKTKYWDYTEDPFNLHGRICLHFSIMWGLASLAVVKIVHPIIASIVNSIPSQIHVSLVIISLILLSLDFLSTIKSLFPFKRICSQNQFGSTIFNNKYELLPNSCTNLENKIQNFLFKLIKNKKGKGN